MNELILSSPPTEIPAIINYSCFIEKETKDQRGQVTCPRSAVSTQLSTAKAGLILPRRPQGGASPQPWE